MSWPTELSLIAQVFTSVGGLLVMTAIGFDWMAQGGGSLSWQAKVEAWAGRLTVLGAGFLLVGAGALVVACGVPVS